MFRPVFRERVRVATEVGDVSMTKQSFRAEADINVIMAKYLRTGILESQSRSVPRYGNFESADDYLSAMVRVRQAEELFARLPASVRDHVRNDPGELLRLVFDPSRREECVELGLISEAKEVSENGGTEEADGSGASVADGGA